MEDGSCHQAKRDNLTNIEGFDNGPCHKSVDNYSNLNGGVEKCDKLSKTLSPFPNKSNLFRKTPSTDGDLIDSIIEIEKGLLISGGDVAPKLPKPIITQHSTFRRVLKRPREDGSVRPRENGDHKDSSKRPVPFKSQVTPHGSLQNTKYGHKRRKLDGQQNEYAQYLGLQPAVKFKCSKCCVSSFESLGMLKEHQRLCSPQSAAAARPAPPAAAPASPAAAAATNFRITRKVYLCSACGTYYENWNLFLHIREVHNRHTCLFCFGMFSQAQKLASHLVVKHNIQEDHFSTKEDLSSKFSDSFYLLCCKCEKVFTERENFIVHECAQAIKQCSVCKVKGSHSTDCPKGFKHKRSSPTDVKNKVKKTPFEDQINCSVGEPITESNTSADSLCSDQKVIEINSSRDDDGEQPVISKTPPVDNKLESSAVSVNNSECHSPIPKASPSSTQLSEFDESDSKIHNAILKNNNNKEDSPESSFTDLEVIKASSQAPDDIEKNDHVSDVLDFDLERSQPLSPDSLPKQNISRGILPTSVYSPKSDQTSLPSFTNSNTTMPQTGADSVKAALKPPPRNRRPPKRYQFKNTQNAMVQKIVSPEVKETINRVPKLTVKVPKILTEKESTSDYSSESEDSDKLTVDIDLQSDNGNSNSVRDDTVYKDEVEECVHDSDVVKTETSADSEIVVAGEDIALTELTLDRPLDRYPLKDLLRVFLSSTVYNCIYCNHARKVAVNAKQLGLHFIAQHRFTATVDSITAEELMPETIVVKIKSCLQQVQEIFLNLEGYDTEEKIDMKFYDHVLECFQCYFVTTVHKDLYMHNRKMHQKTILLCIMCKSNFYSYSELLCHLCPGTYVPNCEIQFRCCLCRHDSIPSAFRLMVHLRKRHHACDVCLDTCQNQSKLSNHVWKHKLHHLCYRCGIAYRNKPDITKHLFWKHGTESVLCKKCLQKRWPHVYHFCIPPNSFVCEECNLTFTKAVSLKVHKRLHSNDQPYSCSEENCLEKFISKKLLKKHIAQHFEIPLKVDDTPKQIIPIDEHEKTSSPLQSSKEIDSVIKDIESKPALKNKKSKKNKKNKEKDNLLIDVNLPALNLSESDSSDESEPETIKKIEEITGTTETPDTDNVSTPNVENMVINDIDSVPSNDVDSAKKNDIPEEPKPEQPVVGIWDNFKIYQAEIEKQTETIQAPKPKHVCDSDHDYCVIPIEEPREDVNLCTPEGTTRELKKKLKSSKKKNKKANISSSSDSSSDSDSSCSCGSNCSCSSSSGSSSSSSSSSDTESSSGQRRSQRKDSDASAVDIMATEESPPRFVLPEPQEVPVAETDLDTDETETDEDFYDEHPQRLANKILAEKRNQLMLLATVAPVNNGTHLDSSRPVTPENMEKVKESKKKVKTKKKKKSKKSESSRKIPPISILPVPKVTIRPEDIPVSLPNKITISLQTNTVIDKSPTITSLPGTASFRSEADSKRASKRRRVPNKFYGYSSDEEYTLKQHLPPKLEWRKEDLPSPSVIQQPVILEVPPLAEVLAREIKPVISPKLIFKEPIYSSSEEDSDSSREGVLQINHPTAELVDQEPPQPAASRPIVGTFPFPRPAGVRQAREGESVYCYCRCPYDEVSEMIACDAEGCSIEWFHFECVGIMVPPKGKWYCPDCRQRLENEEF